MIEWNNGLNIGIKSLDDDHKKLLEIMNELLDAISDDKTANEIGDIFTNLEQFSIRHCRHEETLLKECNYEKFDEHVNHH
ncbi:MAG: hemerythrin domain-containing protein, partial [Campylobacterota bacterium]|nr:hemerythrin domain-containing protein [Campylobacterota bacterium]